MNVLKRFVRGGRTYTFPLDSQVSMTDNFGELVTRTGRLPGADGGFDELGDERGLQEIGNVSAEFWLHFTGKTDATNQRDAFLEMADFGVGRLYMQPTDAGDSERFVWARVNNINIPFNVQEVPHKRLRAQISFQCSDPGWLGAGNQTLWGGGSTWAGGAKWGGTPTAVSGLSTTLTWTNNGNTYIQPKIALHPDVGDTCTDPIIRRVVDGAVVDEVRYIGTLTNADQLVINCRKMSVRLNGVALYTNQFSFKSASWLKLLPGANSIQIKLASAGDAVDVMAQWYDKWV